jgi:Spy/CpxP family protein refolding chaperone
MEKHSLQVGLIISARSGQSARKIDHRKEDKRMKKRKKYFIIGAVVFSLALLTGLGVTAACNPHASWGKGFHPRFHSEDITDFILWKMDKHVKDLNLDDAQKQEYERIKDQVKARITEAIERRREFHRLIHEEINKENPDLNNVANLARERLQKMPDIIGKNLDLFMDFYNRVLTGEQKAKVIEMIRFRLG